VQTLHALLADAAGREPGDGRRSASSLA